MEKEKRRKKKLITELKKNECLAEGKKKNQNPRSDYHNNDVTNCQPVAPQPTNTWAGWAPHEVKALQAEARQKDRNEM